MSRNLLFQNADENEGVPNFYVPSISTQPLVQPTQPVQLMPTTPATLTPVPSATLATPNPLAPPPMSTPSLIPTSAQLPPMAPPPQMFNPNSAFAQPYQPTKNSRYAATPGINTIGSQMPPSGQVPPSATLPPTMAPPSGMSAPHSYNPLPAATFPSNNQPTPPAFASASPVTLTPVDTHSPMSSPVQPPVPGPPVEQVKNYWFYESKSDDNVHLWLPLSCSDSIKLENAFDQGCVDPVTICGGRYTADLVAGVRVPIYWTEEEEVRLRRGSWYASTGSGFQPLNEETSDVIDYNYNNGQFPIKFDTPEGAIVMHNHYSCVLVPPGCTPDEYGVVPEGQPRPKMVKGRITEEELGQIVPLDEDSEAVAHCLILVACGGASGKRSVTNVDQFRSRLLEMKKSKFPVEPKIDILPVHWHESHTEQAGGAAETLEPLTLPSVKRLREFTNTAMMDVMFYTSPIYAQPMVESLTTQIEDMVTLYREKNPNFNGKIAFIGHGISSLILFDILSNQNTPNPNININKPIENEPKSVSEAGFRKFNKNIENLSSLLEKLKIEKIGEKLEAEDIDLESLIMLKEDDLKDLGIPLGPRKKLIQFIESENSKPEPVILSEDASNIPDMTLDEGMTVNVQYNQFDSGAGTPKISYPRLSFDPFALFGFGAPIGLLLALRGVENLGEEFRFQTCGKFLNIFHPFDPFAYRIEPYIKYGLSAKPVQIPHHKGRKRLHLEIADNLGKAAAEVKAGLLRSMRSVMSTVKRAAGYEEENQQAEQIANEMFQQHSRRDSETSSIANEEFEIGQLNSGKRIDYQLQERPLEMFNEYMFAFQSHLGYWTSEDAALLILKQIYEKNPNIFVTND